MVESHQQQGAAPSTRPPTEEEIALYLANCDVVPAAQAAAGLGNTDPCPTAAGPTPMDVAVSARADLVLPLPGIQAWPPTDKEVVGFPAWFHVTTFTPATATANAAGITATVTATPTHTTWHLGDTTLTCTTAGTIWTDTNPNATSDCTHTFTTWTNGATLTATVDVTYHLTWTANTGDGGDLGTITRTAPFPLRIWEIQAVIN